MVGVHPTTILHGSKNKGLTEFAIRNRLILKDRVTRAIRNIMKRKDLN